VNEPAAVSLLVRVREDPSEEDCNIG
jgi:hypothetical protein